ncbi:MAG: energy transducer TonB [Flavobacteriales bacterium]|nr:energy transducer TonB [Flavobacteriales bacterium]MCL4282931.1 energy transducer TonB [Flavobacteriales bacterium]
MTILLSLAFALGFAHGEAQAQRTYLNAVLEPCPKAGAEYYIESDDPDGKAGFPARIYTVDGVLKAQGRYADAECRIPDGHFVFYHPNGKVESEGQYVRGRKDGVWTRHDKWGRELAEKVYDSAPLVNLVYTMAQTMPKYPGGEKAMVRYVQEKVGKTKGDVMASFIVEKNGQLSDVQVTGAKDPRMAEQIASVISSAPHWAAGMQDGQPVRVQMRVPLK